MSFSSGVFSLVAGNPVVTGTTISSTVQNNTMTYVATGLSTCLLKDGTQTATAAIPFVTGVTTTSTTFAVFNTTATTINAFGGASVALNIGNASGANTILGTTTLTGGAGTGTGTFGLLGLINSQTSASGIGNGADATDDTLFTYSLPLNSLSANGKSVFVRASGKTATNANLKTIKLFFAGTDFQTLPQGAYSGAGWVLEYEITRVDSTHVNIVATAYLGTADFKITLFNNSAVADLTANASIIKATGASASSAANDILGYSMDVTFSN